MSSRRPRSIDPDSERGRAAEENLSQLFADVILRLEREGLPVPDLYGDEPAQAAS